MHLSIRFAAGNPKTSDSRARPSRTVERGQHDIVCYPRFECRRNRIICIMVVVVIFFAVGSMFTTDDHTIVNGDVPAVITEKFGSIGLASSSGQGDANETRREQDREAFANQMQVPKWEFVVDDTHKMLYCVVPKTACSKFKRLFYALGTNGTRFQGETMEIHGAVHQFWTNRTFLQETVIKDPSSPWRTFAVVRDPAERMVSGFKDKCLRHQDETWCLGSPLTKKEEFPVFANRIIQKIESGQARWMDDHYRPQHLICGLNIIYPKYVDDLIVYHKDTAAQDTLEFLKRYHLEDYNDGYGKFGNETLFTRKSSHTTRSDEDECTFYRKYFDSDLYQRVRQAMDKDYSLFGLDEPKWLKCLK